MSSACRWNLWKPRYNNGEFNKMDSSMIMVYYSTFLQKRITIKLFSLLFFPAVKLRRSGHSDMGILKFHRIRFGQAPTAFRFFSYR